MVLEEEIITSYLPWGMIVSACATFVSLVAKWKAPYGRYAEQASSIFGFPVPGKLAWVLQECPCVFIPLYCIYTGKN